jgi:hypothetical protein
MSRIAVVFVALLAVLVPVRGHAVFHFANIDEIMSGVGGDTTAQYVEIRMLLGGQGSVAHSRLTAFSCDGSSHAVLLEVPNNVCPANTDGRWTMGTASWATATGVTPDFTFPTSAAFGNACGMICWGAPGSLSPPENPPTWDAGMADNYVDCVAYGGYTGTRQTGDAAASLLAAGNGTMSLQRTADNANDSTDFALAARTPANNGVCATTTTTSVTTSSTVTTTSFPPGTGQPVAGTKLLLKANPSKAAKKLLMLVAKDAAIVAGDPTQLGGSLRVFTATGDGFDETYPLVGHWKAIGKASAVKGYRFTDPTGPIKSVVVKQGKVARAIGKGAGLGHTLAANPDPVTVLLAVGAERDCMSFGGGKFVAGKKYLATGDPPPAACP